MTDKSNYYLDITTELCPMTFVKTKLAIENMRSGDRLEVRLKGAEPLKNVPRSLRELGHNILSLDPEPGAEDQGIYILRVEKA